MDFVKAIVLGVIEGITEWMPVSSTAHIKIFADLLGFYPSLEFYSLFEVVIQLGAIVALVIVFFKKIFPFGKSKNPLGNGILSYVKKDKWILWWKMFVTCLPAILYKLFLEDYVSFVTPENEMTIIGITLIAIGLVFVFIEAAFKNKKPIIESTKDITFLNALIIGLTQLVAALFPGVSRSGSTIIAALLLGISRTTAIEYTYEVSIPVMVGASLMEIIKYPVAISFSEVMLLLAACIVAFIISLFVIRFVLDYIRKHTFIPFGVYRVFAGLIVLILIR